MAFPPTIGQLLNTAAARLCRFLPSRRLGLRRRRGLLHHHLHLLLHRGHLQPGGPGGQPEEIRRLHSGRPAREADRRVPDRILSRLTFPGALYLGAVAALPTILISQTSANFFFGGTSILIVVGVALDTVKQLEAQLMMRNYEGFLK